MFRVGDEIREWMRQERKDALEQVRPILGKLNGHVIAQYVKRAKILCKPEFHQRRYQYQLIAVLIFTLFLTLIAFFK
jgi:hypothetical protein